MTVDYIGAARRHIRDAHVLQHARCLANAGQLFGICVECGLKLLLIRCGAVVDSAGNIEAQFKKHMPQLATLINGLMVLPDGRATSALLSRLPSLALLANWKIDHRYWSESAIPLTSSLQGWE